jgi:two-component system, OmpR family, response regulator CpxR
MAPSPVMIVDDDPGLSASIQSVLEHAGYRVYCASNGREALELLGSVQPLPGLILLDLAMPIMNGEEMLRALHAVHALAAIPVTVVTGSKEPKPEGARALLRKPIDVDALLRIVGQAVDDS